jgi:hypothetical protein
VRNIHQAVQPELVDFALQQGRNTRLGDAEQLARPDLREPTRAHFFSNPKNNGFHEVYMYLNKIAQP